MTQRRDVIDRHASRPIVVSFRSGVTARKRAALSHSFWYMQSCAVLRQLQRLETQQRKSTSDEFFRRHERRYRVWLKKLYERHFRDYQGVTATLAGEALRKGKG